MQKSKKAISILLALLIAIGNSLSVNAETHFIEDVGKSFKSAANNNPISSEFFCADPTSVEYNGRLYVFGTNDHQQYEGSSADKDNTYEKIKSLVIFSTDDMVNWVYHGEINVGEIAPWIMNSWAPSVTSRVEDDGLTHFYLYFSNNGTGVGVITATNPLGPWSDPLGKPLVSYNTPGLSDCPNPFDPGVVIDENGVGWLSFGGGKAKDGTDYMPGSSRIVQLGSDMVSFASDFTEIPAPYFFEASELNYINGTYVYTYCSDWNDHSAKWDYDTEVPSACSMVYMTTKTPLVSDSWEMKGECFKNPGLSGFDYSNNHTHMHKYKDTWYMLYHTLSLKRSMGIKGGYRSLCVDEINVDENTVTIQKSGGTPTGVTMSMSSVNPYSAYLGSEICAESDMSFDTSDMSTPILTSDKSGAWTSVRNVEFTETHQGTDKDSTEPILTKIDTITYNLTVSYIDKATTISMIPSTKDGDCISTADVSENGKYTITCDLNGADKLVNVGYFRASDNAMVTFMLDSFIVNDKYKFNVSAELTNTTEWADGLKNIWNGFDDGDEIYSSDSAVFKYIKDDDAIEFFLIPEASRSFYDTRNDLDFSAEVKGTGRIEVRLDSAEGDILTFINFNSPEDFTTICSENVAEIGGTHDLFFVCSDKDITIRNWQFGVGFSEDSTLTVKDNANDDNSKDNVVIAPENKESDTEYVMSTEKSNPLTGTLAPAWVALAVIGSAAAVAVIKRKKR